MALNSSGTATASVLYGPYGTARYANGAMPTDYTFTGQRGDTTTGLDYYGARYYDPVVGQFTSPDSAAAAGLNRYAYVHDDPETFTDPTGHLIYCQGGCNPHEGSDQDNDTPQPQKQTPPKPNKPSVHPAAQHKHGHIVADGSQQPTCSPYPYCVAAALASDEADSLGFTSALFGWGSGAPIGLFVGMRAKLQGVVAFLKRIPVFGDGLAEVAEHFSLLAAGLVTAIMWVVSGEALLLSQLFKSQSKWTAAQWADPGEWNNLYNSATGIIAVASAAIAGLYMAFINTLAGGPLDVVGDILTIVGGVIAGIANAAPFGDSVNEVTTAEISALGNAGPND